MTTLVPVLLAGGVGTRLWPTSRDVYPKQLLSLTGDGSLLQQAARRALAAAPAGRVVTVTTETHYFLVADQLRDVDDDLARHVIAEPVGRNTAAAVALAALYAAARFADPVLWAAPADHVIARPDALTEAVGRAVAAAAEGRIVTFGIAPADADPGFGYIESGAARAPGVHDVARFVEKPPRPEAERLIAAGNAHWNSGMFVFAAATLLAELGAAAPEVLAAVRAAFDGADMEADPFRVGRAAYAAVPALPIDTAVMERSERLAVVPLDIGWSDVGSWQRLWEVSAKDDDGNVGHGDVLFENSRNTLARSDRRLVACAGVADLVVVETADAVLVADRGDAAGVKALVERLKAAGRGEATAHLTERRPWGSFSVLLEGPRFKIKELTVKPGARLSLQMHHKRSEHWVVVEGTARVTRGDDERDLAVNESTFIPVGTKHRIANPGSETLRIVEVQCGDYVGEDDIVRFEDAYGRAD